MKVIKVENEEQWRKAQEVMYAVNHQELGKSFLEEEPEYNDRVCTLYVEVEGRAVGCVRCFFEQPSSKELQKRGLKMPQGFHKVALTDRLLILPAYRNSRAVLYLVNEIYRQALLASTHLALMECEDHLLKFYKRLGFRPYRYVRYEYGSRYQLFINPWDVSYLKEVGSPFVSVYNKFMTEVYAFIGEKRIGQYA